VRRRCNRTPSQSSAFFSRALGYQVPARRGLFKRSSHRFRAGETSPPRHGKFLFDVAVISLSQHMSMVRMIGLQRPTQRSRLVCISVGMVRWPRRWYGVIYRFELENSTGTESDNPWRNGHGCSDRQSRSDGCRRYRLLDPSLAAAPAQVGGGCWRRTFDLHNFFARRAT